MQTDEMCMVCLDDFKDCKDYTVTLRNLNDKNKKTETEESQV